MLHNFRNVCTRLGASMFSRTRSRFVQLTVGVFTYGYDHLLQ